MNSRSVQDRVALVMTKQQILSSDKIKFFDGKIHHVDSGTQLLQPGSQFFEFWIKIPQQQKKSFSKLVGLFAYSSSLESTDRHGSYTIMNPITNSPLGLAKVEVEIHQTEERAKIWLAKSLTNESIRVLLHERAPVIELESNPSDESIVPDKPQESRPIQCEDISSPPRIDDLLEQEEIKESFQAPVLIAPPKFSLEPSLPPHIATLPEPANYSAINSVDSLELFEPSDDRIRPESSSSHSPPPHVLDQSVDSLISIQPTISPATKPLVASSMVHVLELSIEGPVDPLIASQDSLGYFVCYEFPGLKDQEVCSSFPLSFLIISSCTTDCQNSPWRAHE
jgi:hypothetical protein